MLKPQKRHSQTLSTKKPKPIEITLTKKQHPNNTTLNLTQENYLNQSLEKGYREGLSLVRPLKQKSLNLPQSHTLDLKSLKSKEQKLKQQVCPSYKINWGSTPVNYSNSSRVSEMSVLVSPQQTLAQGNQFTHLIKTNEYKKYSREVHDALNFNPTQFHMNIQDSIGVIKEQQPIVSRQGKQGGSMNSVKSKIKGITKGFLRDGKNISKQFQKEQIKSSQIGNIIQSVDQSESLVIEPSLSQPLQEANTIKEMTQSPIIPQIETKQSFLSEKIKIPDQQNQIKPSKQQQPLTERSALKQHYAELSVRLEQCVQQIVQIERSNNVQKIVELENELVELKNNHEQEKQQMVRKIHQLQAKLVQTNFNRSHLTMNTNTVCIQIKPFSNLITKNYDLQVNSYENEIKQLRHQVTSLKQSLQHYQSLQYQSSFSHQARSSLQLENQIYQTDILKRKQSTLEQVLDMKKKQILNKDSIIQMLLTKEVQKALKQSKEGKSDIDKKKDKVTALVFQMIGYMNGKLTAV